MFSYFTIAQANQVLPTIIKKFEYALAKKNDVAKIDQELQASLSISNKLEDYISIKQKLNSAITKLYQALEDLESTGVMAKSLDEGLLDFPSKRFDKEIWLCWKHGETVIKFWHDQDSGFQGRKPISVSNESLV